MTATAPSDPGPPLRKAYSYLRYSTPEQMRGDSFRRQTALADAYAANRLDWGASAVVEALAALQKLAA